MACSRQVADATVTVLRPGLHEVEKTLESKPTPQVSKEAEEDELPTGLPGQDCVDNFEITHDNCVVSTQTYSMNTFRDFLHFPAKIAIYPAKTVWISITRFIT